MATDEEPSNERVTKLESQIVADPEGVSTGAQIIGARLHRAEHVESVLHVGAMTVILAPA